MQEALAEGQWLCIQNFHLDVQLYKRIEKCISEKDSPHPDFRLWIVSEVCSQIPFSLLTDTRKALCESPKGFSRCISRSFASSMDFFDNAKIVTTDKAPQVLYLISLFHSIMLERSKYNGWNEVYKFGFTDIEAATNVLHHFAPKQNLEAIRNLLIDYSHGVRIDDMHDRKKIVIYISKLFTNKILEGQEFIPFMKSLGRMKVPQNANFREVYKSISSYTIMDSPSALGMDENSGKTAKIISTQKFLSKICLLFAKNKLNMNCDKPNLMVMISLWNDFKKMWVQINDNKKLDDSKKDFLSPFFEKEYQTAKNIYQYVDKSMTSLQCVIEGKFRLKDDYVGDAKDIVNGNLPKRWSQHWVHGPESISPSKWLRKVVSRMKRLVEFINMTANKVLHDKKGLSLSDFFHPMLFLTLIKQETAMLECKTYPFHSLTLRACSWEEENDSKKLPPLTICLHGIIAQGSNFILSPGMLVSIEDKNAFKLPPTRFAFVNDVDSTANSALEVSFDLPFYLNESRNDLLSLIRVRCNSSADMEQCVLSGTALFAEDDNLSI